MEKKTLDFLRELNPDLVKSNEIQFAIDKWYATKDFEKKIDQIIQDKAEELRNDDGGELYQRVYDPNPFGVESNLIGSSGCWYHTEIGIEKSYNDAKEQIIEELTNGEYSSIEDWLSDYDIDEDFEEWDFLVDKIVAKIKTL